jgi:hydroxyethylthiazole kinase-like uncharacterized protein yjeF
VQAVLTPEQMAAADRAAIAAGTPSTTLMERAGLAVARATVALAGGAYGRRVLILCGKGNNAGDGLVAARFLDAWGALPVVVFLNDPGAFRGDPRRNLERLGPVRTLSYGPAALDRELACSDVVVDAIVGTGFSGTLAGDAAAAVIAVGASGCPVVAVDIPSGVDGLSGRVDGPAIRAAVTVTMGAPKIGTIVAPGCGYAGRLEIAGIGIPVAPAGGAFAGLPGPADVAGVLGRRPLDSHKRSVGTVLVVAGSVAMPGAAALATTAALRAGAGLVTLATVAPVAEQMHPLVPEATTLILPATDAGTIAATAVDLILARAETVDAVAIGPGLTTNPETVTVVRAVAAAVGLPLVVDADGLNAVADDPGVLSARRHPTVITPHPGEMSRLAGTSSKAVQADRFAAARETAARLRATVVLKGYRSIVAAPSGETVVITTGGPALATGGTGDVLTGVTAAVLAGGADAFRAAWAASWVHGRAGDLLGERIGNRGVVAGDLPAAVREILHQLEALA